jgi:hypothetical protein
LQAVDEERDVGVIIHKSLKPSRQCEKAANTAGAVLRLIQRNFHFRDRKIFVDLYKQYVRPHLEFSVPAWSPWTAHDIENIESVQKKAVKMVSGLISKEYEARCREIGIKTLAERRIDQDMAQVYRFHKGSGGLQAEKIFVRANTRAGPVTRLTGSASNFKIPAARVEIRRNSFAVRTISKWNELPEEIKNSSNATGFKKALKTHRENGGMAQQSQ